MYINIKSDKMFSVKRKSKFENRYHPNMGRLVTKVTRVYLTFFGIPIQTLHKYRTTYHGVIKDCSECELSKA